MRYTLVAAYATFLFLTLPPCVAAQDQPALFRATISITYESPEINISYPAALPGVPKKHLLLNPEPAMDYLGQKHMLARVSLSPNFKRAPELTPYLPGDVLVEGERFLSIAQALASVPSGGSIKLTSGMHLLPIAHVAPDYSSPELYGTLVSTGESAHTYREAKLLPKKSWLAFGSFRHLNLSGSPFEQAWDLERIAQLPQPSKKKSKTAFLDSMIESISTASLPRMGTPRFYGGRWHLHGKSFGLSRKESVSLETPATRIVRLGSGGEKWDYLTGEVRPDFTVAYLFTGLRSLAEQQNILLQPWSA